MGNDSKNMDEKTEHGLGPVQVQNKDIPLLADVLCIMQDVRSIELQREWQKERMYNITQHLSGIPGGGGGQRGLDESFSQLSELETEHEQRCKDYARQLNHAEKILNSIASRSMRTFVMMKYIMNVPDTEIRRELNMSRRGFERARRCIESASCMAAVKWKERYILVKD
jgi:hypothetical protein